MRSRSESGNCRSQIGVKNPDFKLATPIWNGSGCRMGVWVHSLVAEVMDEGRKRVLAIVGGIPVARHLKTADDLFDSKPSPRTEWIVAAAVQWVERIMRKIENVLREK